MRKGRNIYKKRERTKVHKNKYDKNKLGTRDQGHLEKMLPEIRRVEDISSDRDYLELSLMIPNTPAYYRAVKRLYGKYFPQ